MKLVFEGFENAINIEPGKAQTLQVENPALFARVARSICSLDGEGPFERYSLWEEDDLVATKDAFLIVSDPLVLPWDHRALMAAVTKKIEREILEDEELRREIEWTARSLSEKLLGLGLSYNSDYVFSSEWELKRYLKMMGFGVEQQLDKPYIDSLITFLSLALDAGCRQTIVFVNLKTFLTENEFKVFSEHVFYSNLSVLLLENKRDDSVYEHESKYVVDLQFLES